MVPPAPPGEGRSSRSALTQLICQFMPPLNGLPTDRDDALLQRLTPIALGKDAQSRTRANADVQDVPMRPRTRIVAA
ncbi:hypothetical protein PSP6_250160 [Paraburkholderia tropica]|nr:hypothetical protein PSP6_250160 [Paraburkholderia tropica]